MNSCGEKTNAQSEGISLEEGVGPFRFEVPEEKLHARWVREVVAVKLVKVD